LKPGLGSLEVIEDDTIQSGTHDFLLTFHSNHRPISHRFRDKRRFPSKIAQFSHFDTIPACDGQTPSQPPNQPLRRIAHAAFIRRAGKNYTEKLHTVYLQFKKVKVKTYVHPQSESAIQL